MHIKMFTSAYHKKATIKDVFLKVFYTVAVSSLSSLKWATHSTDWQWPQQIDDHHAKPVQIINTKSMMLNVQSSSMVN